jgi:outer membrane protein TolC
MLVAGLLAGCARFHTQPIAPAQTAADFEARSLADAGLRAFIETNLHAPLPAWPLASWDFTHLTLAAFYFHPDLDVARARWALAQAGKTTAAERPNPTASVTPGYNATTRIPSPWLVTPTLDIPIETAGKRGYRMKQAAQLSEAARLNIASVAWQVRSHLRRTWVDLYLARETELLLRQQQTTQEQVVRLLEAQLAAGAVSPFEVTQARVALDHTRLALHDAERQRGEAHAQLAAAVGLPAPALDPALLSFASLAQPPPELPPTEVRRQALLNRADILGALAEYAAGESALRLEIARQYPDIHLSPGYEFDQGDHKWTLGLSVTLPVLNQNQGPIAEAEARRTELAAQFNALQARVLAELDRATAAYGASRAKAGTAEALLASLKKLEQAARARLEAGEISRLELSTVQLELSQAALARQAARAQAQQAFGDLEGALQSPAGMTHALWTVFPRSAATTPKDSKHE